MQVTFQKYDEYKISEILGADNIPTHWEAKKISQSFQQIGSGTTPKSDYAIYYENGSVNWINTGDLNDNVLYKCKRKVSTKALEDYSLPIYPVGSLIIAMYGATIGKASVLEISGCTNQACCVISKNKKVNTMFLFYWFLAKRNFIISLSYGGGQPNISQQTIKNLRFLSPPLPEQEAIAAYLDEKTAQIDQKIALLQQKAARYADLKQASIYETVTCGLDKNAPMKASGIEWIGKIPVHWDVKRTKSMFIKMSRPIREIDDIVTVFRDGEVTLRKNRRTTGFTHSAKEHGYQGIRAGDLVIHAMDAAAGAVGVSDSDGKSTPVYQAYTPINVNEIYNPYYALLIRQMALSGFIASLGKGIRERSTEFRHKIFAPLHLPVPPLMEQKAIADYLNEKTAHIDKIIAAIETQIEKLAELRKTLINEVVTGQIKVV